MKKKMSNTRKAALQGILHKMREKVIAEIEAQLGRELNPIMFRKIDVAMDTGDWGIFEAAEDMDLRLLEIHYKRYKEIAEAFRRLESGTYGLCEGCGEDIPIARLEAEPATRYCVACLGEIEARETGGRRKILSL